MVLDELVRLSLYNENTSSKSISFSLKDKGFEFSPSCIRYELQKLHRLGLLYEPYLSAGKMPTNKGLSWFVDYMQQDLKEVSDRFVKVLTRLMREENTLPGKLLHSAGNMINRSVFFYDGDLIIRNYNKVFLDKSEFSQVEVLERVRFMENLEGILDIAGQYRFEHAKLFFAEKFNFKNSNLSLMIYNPYNQNFLYGTINPIISDYDHQVSVLRAINKVINQNLLE